jgi:hypothetical protein
MMAALQYAADGIPVFPCEPGGKKPLTATGFNAASTDAATITRWWQRWAEANVAAPTGVPWPGCATFDVLDVDVRPTGNGWSAFSTLKRLGLLAGAMRVHRTPTGNGAHLLFPATAGRTDQVRGRFLDLKRSGGYILLPPSVIDGRAYEVVREYPSPGWVPLDWERCRVALGAPRRPVRYAADTDGLPTVDQSDVARLLDRIQHAPDGERHHVTRDMVVVLAHGGALRDNADQVVAAGVAAGLPPDEVADIIRWALVEIAPQMTLTASGGGL